MRLGVSTGFGANTAQEWIERVLKFGAKTVVFPLDCTADPKKIEEYCRLAKENDITIAEVGIWRNTLAKEENERKKWTEYAIGQLRLADEIGARCCVNVAGTPHGPRWDGGYAGNFSKETRREIVTMVRTLLNEVKPKRTKFTLEPMPWMVPTGPDDYLQLLEEVDRDGFGVHLDLINMVTSPQRYFFLNEFMDECFEKLGSRICSCHLKDILLLPEYTFRLKECACGEGILDVKRYLSAATKVDPDLPVIIEHLANDEEYERSIAYVRSL